MIDLLAKSTVYEYVQIVHKQICLIHQMYKNLAKMSNHLNYIEFQKFLCTQSNKQSKNYVLFPWKNS